MLSKSMTDTKALGSTLSKLLTAGDVILLIGDLGAGKTTLTKGIAEGLGIEAVVKSPTFNLIREYQQGRLPLYHMDFYRLEGVGGGDLGLEEYFEGDGVSLIEWPKFVAEDLPTSYLAIKIARLGADDSSRQISFKAVGAHYEALLQRLEQELKND